MKSKYDVIFFMIICLLNLLNFNMLGSNLSFLGIMKYSYFRKKSLKIALKLLKIEVNKNNTQGNLLNISEGCRPCLTDYLKRIFESIVMYIGQTYISEIETILKTCLYVIHSSMSFYI